MAIHTLVYLCNSIVADVLFSILSAQEASEPEDYLLPSQASAASVSDEATFIKEKEKPTMVMSKKIVKAESISAGQVMVKERKTAILILKDVKLEAQVVLSSSQILQLIFE